ncbi:hypothetical protein BDV25DRAFT_160036 [Aspergillus avenaceus]|uniref:Uncharacterized protein n=1 Tax=Aspergillus avenaceus TaxID=36643 RepID=A0A5N6TMK2_ASPAV|nr:hypothetical protein BDV25DRAFT_160036 [Aspergillus avenaceus]
MLILYMVLENVALCIPGGCMNYFALYLGHFKFFPCIFLISLFSLVRELVSYVCISGSVSTCNPSLFFQIGPWHIERCRRADGNTSLP